MKPTQIAAELAAQNIFIWHGHNYAYEPTFSLGIPEDEGVARIGLAHYNTAEEVDEIIKAVEQAVT